MAKAKTKAKAKKSRRKRKDYVNYSVRIPDAVYKRTTAEAGRRTAAGVYTSAQGIMLEALVLLLDRAEQSAPLNRVQKAAR